MALRCQGRLLPTCPMCGRNRRHTRNHKTEVGATLSFVLLIECLDFPRDLLRAMLGLQLFNDPGGLLVVIVGAVVSR